MQTDSIQRKKHFPKKMTKIISPVADGRIKTPGGDQELRTSASVRDHPIQGESHLDFLGGSEGFLPQPQYSYLDAGEAINDFWSMSGSFIDRHYVEPRVKLYSPREESFPIPLKYIDLDIPSWMSSKRNASMIIGISMDLETCQIIGQVSHNLLYWKKNLPKDICGPGQRLTRKTVDIQARSSMARVMEVNGKKCQAEGEAKVVE